MAEDPAGTIRPDRGGRSIERGDAPDHLKRRYYLDGRGGPGLGFYVDARIQTAAFRDEGRRLSARRTDPHAIRDMAAIAAHRGWTNVAVRGDEPFRREAWLALRTQGLEVRGYRPTERDRESLRHQTEILAHRKADQSPRRPNRYHQLKPLTDPAARARLKVVEAVVRDRVRSPEVRGRIVAAAREKLATWLEKDARIDTGRTASVAPSSVEPPRRPQRTRAR